MVQIDPDPNLAEEVRVKTCSKCKKTKPVSEFNKNNSKKDKLQSRCRQCEAEYNQSPEHKAKKAERQQSPEYKAQKKAYNAKRQQSSEVKIKKAAQNSKRREKQQSISEPSITPELRAEIFKRFGHKCFKCGSTKRLCIDHHYPLKNGHAVSIYNAVCLCQSCNSAKKDKLPEKFYTPKQLYILLKYYQVGYGKRTIARNGIQMQLQMNF